MQSSGRETLVHGLMAGAIGYVTVILFFTVVSLATGQSPFSIPSAMGSALFMGGGDGTGAVDARAVLAFNALHALVSLAIGLLVAWLLQEAENHHELWYVVVLVLVAGFFFALLGMGVLGAEVVGAVSWRSVFVANLLWAAAMGAYLYRCHRELAHRIDADLMGAG